MRNYRPLYRLALSLTSAALLTLLTTLAVAQPLDGPHQPIGPTTGPQTPTAGNIISNGLVLLGVNTYGQLIVPGGSPSPVNATTAVGLRHAPTGYEGLSHGDQNEGWGVADALTGLNGWANNLHGISNLVVNAFSATGSTAQSVVSVGGLLSVTHAFQPSISPNLYQVDVTVTNQSTATLDLRYRRVADWDIEPTAFAEYVTLDAGHATRLAYTSNNGFAHPNPLVAPTSRGYAGTFFDAGPGDYGALFDLNFGALAAGASRHFVLYYGGAATEAEAIAALSKVGAEAYSFGQPGTPDGPTLGTPDTFILAFTGIGGTPLFAPVTVQPPAARAWGEAGTTVVYTPTLINATGLTDTFDLALVGATWPSALSVTRTASLPDRTGVTFTVAVSLPLGAAGQRDVVQVIASPTSNPALTATTTLTTTARCAPRSVISGQSAQSAALDDVYQYGGQPFTAITLNAHTTSGNATLTGTVQGFEPVSGQWQTLAQSAWLGPDVNLLNRVDVPPVFTAVRVQLADGWGWPEVYYDYAFTLCRATQIDLQPSAAQGYAEPAHSAAYTFTLTNNTFTVDQFDLSVSNSVWPVTVSALNGTPLTRTPPLSDLGTYTFTAQVTVPLGTPPAAQSVVTLTARSVLSPAIASTVALTTTALCNPRQNLSGQTAPGATFDDVYDVHGQPLTYLYVKAYPSSSGSTLTATVQGRVNGVWQVLTQQSWQGTDRVLIDHWDVPSIYSAVRVQLHDLAGSQAAYDYAFSVCRAPIVDLRPAASTVGYATAGTQRVYTYTLTNLSLSPAQFNLSTIGQTWPTSLRDVNGALVSQTPVLADLGDYTFTVQVSVPVGTPPGQSAAVTLLAAHTLSPTLTATSVITTIAASGQVGYVFDAAVPRVQVLDRVLHAPIDTLDLTGGGLWRGALSPDGRWLYATSNAANTVQIISTTARAAVAVLPVGAGPHGLAFTPDGTIALVANQLDNTVSVIDTQALTVTDTLPVGLGPLSVATQPCLRVAYVSHNQSQSVGVIDLATRQLVDNIGGFAAPWDVVVAPTAQRVYVSDQGAQAIGVIDTASNALVALWPVPGGLPASLALSPDGRWLYVADMTQGAVRVLDTTTGQISATLPTGGTGAWGLEVFADNTFAYVTNPAAGTVGVLDLATGTLTRTLAVGGEPRGMALFPSGQRVTLCADLSLRQQSTPLAVPAPDQSLRYTLTVTNSAGVTATQVTMTDTLPAGVAFNAASTSQGTCGGSGPIVCALGALSPGATATMQITITPGALGVITNTATVSANPIDPLPADNVSTLVLGVGTANLRVRQSAAPDPVLSGSVVQYTVTITNAGPNAAQGVKLLDVIPAGATFDSVTSSQGACTVYEQVQCDLGDVVAGGTIDVTVGVLADVSGPLTNTATVSAYPFDPDLGDNQSSYAVAVLLARDLAITSSDQPDPVPAPGQPLTYTLSVVNFGPLAASGVTVIDTVPISADLAAITTTQGVCGVIDMSTCDLGDMAAGGQVTVTVVVTPTEVGTLLNRAEVSTLDAEFDLANNVALETTIVGTADVALNLTAKPITATMQHAITYTLVVSNAGPDVATNVVLTDGLPLNVNGVSIWTTRGSCTLDATCHLGDLLSSEVVTVTLVITPMTAGLIENRAGVVADQFEPQSGNNAALVTTLVQASYRQYLPIIRR